MTERLRDALDVLRGELKAWQDNPGFVLPLRVASAEVCRVAEAEREADAKREVLLARALDYIQSDRAIDQDQPELTEQRWYCRRCSRYEDAQVPHGGCERAAILREAGRDV